MNFLDSLLPKYDADEAKKNKRLQLEKEMEIFDSLSPKERDFLNYSTVPMEPSLYLKGAYDDTPLRN